MNVLMTPGVRVCNVCLLVVVKNGIRMNVNAFIQSIRVRCVYFNSFVFCSASLKLKQMKTTQKLNDQYLRTEPRMNIEYIHMRYYPD